MLRLNTRIGGSDSTPTTAFAGPRRCRFRTKGVTVASLSCCNFAVAQVPGGGQSSGGHLLGSRWSWLVSDAL